MKALFKTLSFTETNKEIHISAVIVPYSDNEDDPFSVDDKIKNELSKIWKENKAAFTEAVAKTLKEACIEAWSNAEEKERVEKLQGLRMFVVSRHAEFNEELVQYEITIVMKPSLTPLFEEGFQHTNTFYKEEIEDEAEET